MDFEKINFYRAGIFDLLTKFCKYVFENRREVDKTLQGLRINAKRTNLCKIKRKYVQLTLYSAIKQ